MKKVKDKKVEGNIANTKDKYVEKPKTEIDKWNAELKDLDAKITVADADAKARIEHKEHIDALGLKRDEARNRHDTVTLSLRRVTP